MDRRLIGMAIGMCFLLGCQSPVKRSLSSANAPASDNDIDIDQEIGERAEPGEADTDRFIADTITGYINRRYSDGRRPAMRDAHAKAHGCVRATFDVDAGLPDELRQGVFVPGKRYQAWIRFSNGASEINPDKTKDARGMAIKLTGVAGAKILPEEKDATTQDFIMINHPYFFVDSPEQYLAMLKVFHKKIIFDKTNAFNALGAAMHLGLHDTRLALKINATRIANPLYGQYWSMTPYRLGVGPGRKAIKFFAKSCANNKPKAPGFFSRPEADYLQQAMAGTLSSGDACFDFYLQTFKDFESTPIEQSTVEWKEDAAPPVLVARITIPAQKFDSSAQMTFCENLSYTPWHALPEHKPLGTVNRARRVVYTAVSKARHGLNGASRSEPTGDERF
ncbi:MAG: catalase family protein [Sulfuricaulis sp.]|nr:catalase family protein [Sulfuricaulis sp.]